MLEIKNNESRSWVEICLEAVNLAFIDNRVVDDQDKIKQAILLFEDAFKQQNIDVAWPFLKCADLVDQLTYKISLWEKAYEVEKNIYSCINLIKIYENDLVNYNKWLLRLIEIDQNNEQINYYIENYFKRLRIPKDFCAELYKSIHQDLSNMDERQLIDHYFHSGIQEGRNYKILYDKITNNSRYVTKNDNNKLKTQIKVIAHYFPQYHVIQENENWWGQGFTDWVNVKKAKPLFPGHLQPHIPDDYLGYYNLTDVSVQKKQIELAKQYGIYGFCFYAYWFNGKTLLEKPLNNYLENKELDLPFCICWANENWTRRWDGLDDDVLISQKYSPKDDIKFIEYMSKYIKDSRYIKVDGKPLIMLYRPSVLPNAKETADRWRNWCRENGIGEIYLVYPQSFTNKDPKEYGFDAASEFPPNNGTIEENMELHLQYQNQNIVEISKSSWDHFLFSSNYYEKKDYTLFRCVMPSWDNSARKKTKGHAFIESEPAKFQHMVENAFDFTLKNNKEEERIVFVNAWNEWAEGCHLEPDKEYGYGWLQAIKNAHLLTNKPNRDLIEKVKNECELSINSTKEDLKPSEIAIVYHSYYPEYLDETIDYAESSKELEGCWFIITAPENKLRECKQIVSKRSSNFRYLFLETRNKGRDILPLFKIYDNLLSLKIKAFCKIHSKKSPYVNLDGDLWRKNLIGNLLDSKYIQKILKVLSENEYGIILPKEYVYYLSDEEFNSPENAKRTKRFAGILGVDIHENSVFTAGSMFWSKIESLIPMYIILNMDNETYFPEEQNQMDNTISHVCERLFSISAESVGLKTLGY